MYVCMYVCMHALICLLSLLLLLLLLCLLLLTRREERGDTCMYVLLCLLLLLLLLLSCLLLLTRREERGDTCGPGEYDPRANESRNVHIVKNITNIFDEHITNRYIMNI